MTAQDHACLAVAIIADWTLAYMVLSTLQNMFG